MVETVLAGMRGHLGRLTATALAVVFGVAFVAGTLVFEDTTRAAYTKAFARMAFDVDVAVRPGDDKDGHSADYGPRPGLLTAAQLETVRRLPDVALAEGRMIARLALLDRRGRPVTNFDLVGVAISTDGDASLRPYDVLGQPPGPGQALLDTDTAQRLGYRAGDTISVADAAGTRHQYPLSGLIDFGVFSQFRGESVVGLPADAISGVTGTRGYQEIVVRGRDGVTTDELTRAVAGALGTGPNVVTGEQRRDELIDQSAGWIEDFRVFLLLFGLVSLIVAAFVIYNTFGVLAALRIRQTALMRCVGTTRRQVFAATLLESAVLGLLGGGLGVLLGVGVAYGLVALLNATVDYGMPLGSPVLGPGAVAAGLALGLVVLVRPPARPGTPTAPPRAPVARAGG